MGILDYKHLENETIKEHNIKLNTKKEKAPVINFENNKYEEIEKTKEKLENLIELNEKLKNHLKNKIANSVLTGSNSFFDKTLLDNLDTFHNFMKSFIPGLPPYYTKKDDGSVEISLQAYIDAKDYILNEFGFNNKNIIEEIDYNGNLNIERMHFALDYSVSSNGNIYKGNNLVFNSNRKDKIIVDYIDFSKGIIKFKPGVFVKIDDILNSKKLKDELVNNNKEITNKNVGILDFSNFVSSSEILEELEEEDKELDKKKYENLIEQEINKDITLEDLENIAPKDNTEDVLDTIKKIIMDVRNFPEGMQTCNTNKVNYLWLLFLIIIGGGSEGEAPFPQDCSVCGYYNKPQRKAIGMGGTNGTGGHYSKPRNYRTGHNKLYSKQKGQGLKVSLIQMLVKFLDPFFDINISPLEFSVAGAHIKLLPAIDIGAFIEHCLLKFQEYISKEIRSMQGCDSQYIIPKLKETGDGIFFDGMEELNNNGKNSNDIEIYFRRNFAILWNYTHYHSKYNEYSEYEKREEMIRLYKTLKMSRERSMSMYDIEECYKNNFHIMFSDIVLDYHTAKASDNTEYGYISKIQPGSTTKIFAAKAFENVDVNVDPSNVNKVIELGLFASYNCDAIDKLDLFEPDYSDSSFQPNFIL